MKFKFVLPTLLALAAMLCPLRGFAGVSLEMRSDAGDGIGLGQSYSFGDASGTFEVSKLDNGVDIAFRNSDSSEWWHLNFGAPGNALFQRAVYAGATYYPFHDPGDPGLEVYGDWRGPGTVSGGFVVKDIAYGPNETISRFWVVFEQHADGAAAALRGEFRFNVNVVTQVFAPISQVVAYDHDVDFMVNATDQGGRATKLTAANLPAGATFIDHGDHTGTFHWHPSLAQSGATYRVTFSADNGAGGIDSTMTAIDVRGITRLTMSSGADDPIGSGATFDFGPADGTFAASASPYPWDNHELTVSFTEPNFAGSWTLHFTPPDGAVLAAGAYAGSGWNPATLDVRHGFDSATKVGNFQVKDILVEGGRVRRFWATFEQYTGEATTPLKGEILFNAPAVFSVTAPIAPAVNAGGVVDLPVSAAGGAGASFHLSASQLPTGSTFTDHGDNTGTLHWQTAVGDIGTHRVTFAAQDSTGGVRSATTAIAVKGVMALRVKRSPYGSDRTGATDDLDERGSVPRLTQNTGAGITVSFSDKANYGYFGNTWFLNFAAPGNTKLAPGLYRGAIASLPSDPAPYLYVSKQSEYPSNTLGVFEVKEIEYGADDSLKKFHVTFEQDAIGSARLSGEFRFNSTDAVSISAPLQQIVTFGNAIDFDVSASAFTGGTPALTASNLPANATFTDRGNGTGHFHWLTAASDKGTRVVTFKAMIGGGAAATASAALEVNGTMALTLNSQQSDPVGLGADYSFNAGSGRFTAVKNADNGVTVSFTSTDGSQPWTLFFSAPGNAPLAPGAYSGATRYYDQVSTSPGLLVTGSSAFSFTTITGSFVIKEIVIGAGGTIDSFWATFEQHADGATPALAGEIKFNVTASVQLSVPTLVTTPYGSTLDVNISALSITGGSVKLTAAHLPQGASFTDRGDGTGTLHWPPPYAQIGSYAVTFTAENAAHQTDTATTKIEVSGITSLVLKSDPGDDVGDGKSYDFPRTAGRFFATKYGSGVQVNFFDGHDSWNILLIPPDGSTLAPGTYTGANGDFSGTTAQMQVRGPNGWPYDQTGAFRIKQLVLGANDSVESFWAVFEQHDHDGDPALVGEIKYNATAAAGVSIYAPFQTRLRYGETIEFDVTATNSTGTATTLKAKDLPANAVFTDHGDGTATFHWQPGIGDRGVAKITFTATTGAGDTDSTLASIDVRGATSLVMESQPGDSIGGGKSYSFGADAGSFNVSRQYDGAVTASFRSASGKDSWYLNFAAPGNVPLQKGSYTGAMHYPAQSSAAPGLDVNGNSHGTSSLTGTFTVKHVEYGAGNTIVSFWVTFEQHAGGAGPALIGEFKYNAWPESVLSAPFTRRVSRGQAIDFEVTATDVNGGIFTLGATHLPTGATFIDHHDNTGTLHWQTDATQFGQHVVTFTASNSSGAMETANTAIEVRGVMALAMRSDTDDYVGDGRSYYFPETAGDFSVRWSTGNSVAFHFEAGHPWESWDLIFEAPGAADLQQGVYTGAVRSPFQDLHSPGLDVSGDGRGANTLDGTFTVKQIVFAPNGGPVTNFWATFEQRADGDAAALRGEIKFNADAPDDPEVLGASLFDWQKVAGSFRGVAGNPRSSLLSASGPVDLQISKTGLLTGKVRLGGRTYFFHGALNSSGYVTLIAKSGDGRIVTVKFNVLSSSDRFRVTGSIVDGDGNRTAFTAGRAMHPHVNDSLAGRYTFVMRAETGDDVTQNGWGRIVVSTAGALRILGTTADSRIFEATALPNEDGSWPIHLDTFVTRGTLSGTLNAADLVSSDIRGVLRWFRPATAAGAYRSAMDAQLILEAARYTPPTPLLLQLPFGSAIFRATGNRSTAFDQLVTFAENTALAAVPAPNRSRVVLLADARTGAILGNFQSAHRRLAKFHGIIYQKTGIGMGTFTEGTEAGIFTLAP